MLGIRCRCGKITGMTSTSVPECMGCKDCKTTLASSEYGHQELQPHDLEPRFNTRTGIRESDICRRCGYDTVVELIGQPL